MSLDNLVKIGKLHRHTAERDEIQRLLRGVERGLQDAQIATLSPEGRFAAAYEALLRIATVALRARGYRTGADQPGHHAITLQSLPLTLGIDADLLAELDAFRRRRNLAAYEGDCGSVRHAFNSFFSSFRNRQSVPRAMSSFGGVLIMPTSCRRKA